MEDAIDFIQSRPLIGYQMDGSHLNNVLVSLARQQQQLMDTQNRLNDRLADIADDVREIREHQKQLESVIGELGGPEQLHQVRSRIADVERAVDGLVSNVQDAKVVANAAGRDADQAGRLADDANRAALSLRDAVGALGGDMDRVAHQLEAHRTSISKALGDLDKDRHDLEHQMHEAMQEVLQRAERMERESGVERLRQMLDELSDRTDENFRSVEESARAVDAELSRQGANQAALRTEISALDERARTALAALSSDIDNKHHMLLDAFRQYEAGWTDLEEHMVRAGQMLASRKQRSPGSTSIRR
ncbi:hypothetical protein conserved [Leishmania donovani]|uniref:Uncharacterized protein n=3 Tax=Leishmania donovani species complex TaxID=38574 RepID=A4HY92_LEIIN|nr:conserved hypothetical protein [Leishmania infantum JPCM5]TPP41808.1 hypothetical protein CGC20_8965 [Leishmania donovani]CAC9482861.1 hypothetical_protein_-_conserved [Leishmania infantum]CAJ1988187.1 hypothetical protein conserved [Leishmania donovani]CAM67276.1 conserved hypothetical protein [Leishmania infantum JPCM5]SUZ41168.1 hypothetical_protein_-_conserved [Leishmania infantum]|eukprot:XP_001465033.1 conserved hypothetical protein [Leishmania infantum JPCM5]